MFRISLFVLSVMLGTTTQAHAHDVRVVQPPPVIAPPLVVQPSPYVQPYYPVQPYYHARPRNRSILSFGMRGTFSGALVGLGASYFAARHSSDDWRTVGLSVSIGALSGAAFGLSLGVFDHMDLGGAYYVSRDLSWGVLFGAMIGTLGGGIAALGDRDAEAVLLGAAAGSLGGLGLGLLTGIIEGQYRVHTQPLPLDARRVHLNVAQLTGDSNAWGARVHGRF